MPTAGNERIRTTGGKTNKNIYRSERVKHPLLFGTINLRSSASIRKSYREGTYKEGSFVISTEEWDALSKMNDFGFNEIKQVNNVCVRNIRSKRKNANSFKINAKCGNDCCKRFKIEIWNVYRRIYIKFGHTTHLVW